MISRNTHMHRAPFLLSALCLTLMVVCPTQIDQLHAQTRQATSYAKRTPAQFGFGETGTVDGRRLPRHLQYPQSGGANVAQVAYQEGEMFAADGAILGQPMVAQPMMGQALPSGSGLTPMSQPIYDGQHADGGVYQENYTGDPGYLHGEYFEGDYGHDDHMHIGHGDHGHGGCASCGGSCEGPDCVWRRMDGIFSNADYRLGVHGFKNPLNRDQDGSFGFHGGINLGLPLTRLSCGLFSGQFGVNSVQSNLSGSSFTNEGRNQLFVTGGVFRRVDQGLQGGVVYDYLQDDWYTNVGISQLRGELSWVYASGNVFGFRFAHGLATDTANSVLTDANGNQSSITESWRANDQYRFFYRRAIAGGDGNLDFFAGYTEEDQTMLGIDFNTPIRGMMRFYGGFTYLLPEQTILSAQNSEETWNVQMGIQFSPYRRRGYNRYNVPMFDVADNGTFQVFPN